MRIKGFLAILLLVVVIVYFLYIVKAGGQEQIQEQISAFDRTKHELTKTNMLSLEKTITMFTANQGRTPKNLREITRMAPITTGLNDAWNTRIKYERISDLEFRLISAGADRQFGTADDISMTF